MLFRMISLVLVLGLVGLMFVKINSATTDAVENDPARQEQKAVLKDATGINTNDPKAVRQYALDQAKELQRIQDEQRSMIEMQKAAQGE